MHEKKNIGVWAVRFDLALQQNEIMDVFYDDWTNLADEDSSFGSKADNHLKVPPSLLSHKTHYIHVHAYITTVFVFLTYRSTSHSQTCSSARTRQSPALTGTPACGVWWQWQWGRGSPLMTGLTRPTGSSWPPPLCSSGALLTPSTLRYTLCLSILILGYILIMQVSVLTN